MGIQIVAATLAMVGIMAGSAFGGTASLASANKVEDPPRIECTCPGDCTPDRRRLLRQCPRRPRFQQNKIFSARLITR